jgi:hypothetical protein
MQSACAVLHSRLVCPAVQYFSTLSHKRHDFREKKVIYRKMFVLISLQICLKYFLFLEDLSEIGP